MLVEDAFAFFGKALLGLVVGHPRRILVVEVAAHALQGAGGALEGLRHGAGPGVGVVGRCFADIFHGAPVDGQRADDADVALGRGGQRPVAHGPVLAADGVEAVLVGAQVGIGAALGEVLAVLLVGSQGEPFDLVGREGIGEGSRDGFLLFLGEFNPLLHGSSHARGVACASRCSCSHSSCSSSRKSEVSRMWLPCMWAIVKASR